ncbi:MAG: tRNA 2-thiouridine(34) synthase MnmA [Deltaproteobacteria bacterium]|nr:tRNA 2-thiouridine(34) synthase MnmA [Deltaproteobacteria bacterium]
MSGGVDSSAAALILSELGYEVIGVTMKLIDGEVENAAALAESDGGDGAADGPEGGHDPIVSDGQNDPKDRACCSFRDILDARMVSQQLNFDHQVHNFCLLFKKQVIDRFVEAYARGRTPNPCVDCNRFLKFGPLFERAVLLGCAKLATGHYAKIERSEKTGLFKLKKARDAAKDQSYFLYGLSQKELERTLFPLGDYLKEEIRALAATKGIVNAQKPESQDICFVPNGRYDLFLEKYGLKNNPGDIVNTQGQVLGTHKGLHRYTVGQRKGLGLRVPRPMYVVRLDPAKNLLVVGSETELYSSWALVEDVNVISGQAPTQPFEAQVKVRYRQTQSPAQIVPLDENRLKIIFQIPQKAVAPGQAAVFYHGDEVLGGGTICQAG